MYSRNAEKQQLTVQSSEVSIDAATHATDSSPMIVETTSGVSVSAASDVAQVRPWVRYWARMFDIYLASVVGGIVVGMFNPDAFNESGSNHVYGLIVIFVWMFIESFFLSVIGTTPGKWLFKTRLIPPSGKKLEYSTALSRSFKVWWRGLGIGFPAAGLITLTVAKKHLSEKGITTWDRDDGFTVVHERIGLLRVIVAVMFFVGLLLLVIVSNVPNV